MLRRCYSIAPCWCRCCSMVFGCCSIRPSGRCPIAGDTAAMLLLRCLFAQTVANPPIALGFEQRGERIVYVCQCRSDCLQRHRNRTGDSFGGCLN